MKDKQRRIVRDSGERKINVSGRVDPTIKEALERRCKVEDKKESQLLEIALYEYLTR